MEASFMMKIVNRLLVQIWFPIFVILIWNIYQVCSKNPFFPSFSDIHESLSYLISENILLPNLLNSFITLTTGYLAGSILGIIFALAIATNRVAVQITLPITNFIRCVPSVAKIPVIMAILGLGMATRIAAVSVAVFFPVFLGTLRAVLNIDKKTIEHIQVLKLGSLNSHFKFKFLTVSGEILTNLQAALQIAVLVTIVSEMLGSGFGIGAFVLRSQGTFMIADMWVGILIIGLLGLIVNEAFNILERRLFPWYFSEQRMSK